VTKGPDVELLSWLWNRQCRSGIHDSMWSIFMSLFADTSECSDCCPDLFVWAEFEHSRQPDQLIHKDWKRAKIRIDPSKKSPQPIRVLCHFTSQLPGVTTVDLAEWSLKHSGQQYDKGRKKAGGWGSSKWLNLTTTNPGKSLVVCALEVYFCYCTAVRVCVSAVIQVPIVLLLQ